MEPDRLPLEELESIRQKLIRQIAEAEQMFPSDKDGRELRASKAALKCVEESIQRAQDCAAA